uniref:Gametocyte specific factor 1 n=1 Tax=Buteo japonicus TaxID=224669 RepID=A0A8C0BM80_9AVES
HKQTYRQQRGPRLIQCPYNKHHRIRACRFPYHLVKCRKSYPEVAKELATCPFNARHLVPQADLSDHIMKCNDKGFIEQDIVNQSSGFQREQMNAVSTWQAPPCDEDWETGEELPHLPHCCLLPGPVLQLYLGQCESRDAVRLGLTCRTPCLCSFLKTCTSPPSRLFLV